MGYNLLLKILNKISDFNKKGSNRSEPSRVDVSALETLAGFSMPNLEELKERLESLKEKEGFETKSNHPWKGDAGRYWVINYWSRILNWVDINIWIYENSDYSKNVFEVWDKNRHKGLEKKELKISDDIEVILWHSLMYRVAEDLYLSNNRRNLYTCIRIGNIIINFWEYFYVSKKKESGIPTSKNIEIICQVLRGCE